MGSSENGQEKPKPAPITLKHGSASPPKKLVSHTKSSGTAEAKRPSWNASFPRSVPRAPIPSSNRKPLSVSSNCSRSQTLELVPSTNRTLSHEVKPAQCVPDRLETPDGPEPPKNAEVPVNAERQDIETFTDEKAQGKQATRGAENGSLPRKGTFGYSTASQNLMPKTSSSTESEDSLRITIHRQTKTRNSHAVSKRDDHVSKPNVQQNLQQCPYFEDAELTGSETEVDERPQEPYEPHQAPSGQSSSGEDVESKFRSIFARQRTHAERRHNILNGSSSIKSVRWDPAIVSHGPIIAGGYKDSRHTENREASALPHPAFLEGNSNADVGLDNSFEQKKTSGPPEDSQTATARRNLDASLEEFAKTISQMKKGDRSKIQKLLEALKNIDSGDEPKTDTSLEEEKHSDKPASSKFSMKGLNPLAPSFRDLSGLKAHISPKKADNRRRPTRSPVGRKRPSRQGSSDESKNGSEESWDTQNHLKPAQTTPTQMIPVQTAPIHTASVQAPPIQTTSIPAAPFAIPDPLGSLNLAQNGVQLTSWIYPIPITFPNELHSSESYFQQHLLFGTFAPTSAPVPPPCVPPYPFPQPVSAPVLLPCVPPRPFQQPVSAPVTPFYVPTETLQIPGNTPPAALRPGRISLTSSTSSTVTESDSGRTANSLDPNWAEQVLGKFMSKFPMTGEQAAPPTPKFPNKRKAASEPNQAPTPFFSISEKHGGDSSPVTRLSTKTKHATVIQQQLEEILLHEKEKKAFGRLSAQLADRRPVKLCMDDLICMY
jgi:hypothetical protein